MSNFKDVKDRKGIITLKNGEEIEIFYSMYAFGELEDKYGTLEAALKDLTNFENGGQIRKTKELIRLGTIWSDNAVDADHILKGIDARDFTKVLETCVEQLSMDAPTAGEDPKM